jgi:c-di-AMP phosphodiesterase-like protein
MNRELNKLIIKELLLSKEVFLVAHNNIDLDAFASMAGFSLLAKKYKNKVYIIIDDKEIEPSTKTAISTMNSKVNIIKLKEVEQLVSNKSILFVLDTNKKNRICAKDILDKFKKVVVIDHHSKNPDTIKEAIVFIDEKATSTCEIVASLLHRFRVKVPRSYATIMLGGIVLDTNNFMYKMTRNSFYYCYYLSTKGADINEAQLYFKQDLQEYVNRSKIIANTEIKGEIAIATGKQGRIYKSQDLAKTADLLLEFKGIKTSFAIGHLEDNKVGISMRSVGKLNAGKLMETFGGGGNKIEAAAVVKSKSLKKVYEELQEKIK